MSGIKQEDRCRNCYRRAPAGGLKTIIHWWGSCSWGDGKLTSEVRVCDACFRDLEEKDLGSGWTSESHGFGIGFYKREIRRLEKIIDAATLSPTE